MHLHILVELLVRERTVECRFASAAINQLFSSLEHKFILDRAYSFDVDLYNVAMFDVTSRMSSHTDSLRPAKKRQ